MPRQVVAAAAVALMFVSGACGRSATPSSGAGPGVISGTYGVHTSSSSDITPMPGVQIGLFLHEVSFGGPAMSPTPEPITHTVTGADGSFRFDGLDPGRYFVLPMTIGASGRWAVVTSSNGAHVELTGCSDCPVAL